MDQLEDFDTMPDEPEPPVLPPESQQNPLSAGSKKEKKKHSQGKSKPHAMPLHEFQTGGSTENGISHGVDSASLPKVKNISATGSVKFTLFSLAMYHLLS